MFQRTSDPETRIHFHIHLSITIQNLNVMVEWLTLLLCACKFPVSKLAPENGYSGMFFVVFPVPPCKFWDITLN
jgi:hypothetical protein